MIHPEGETQEEMEANMMVSAMKIYECFATLLAARKAGTEPKNDIISTLLHSEVEGKPLTDEELVNIMFLLIRRSGYGDLVDGLRLWLAGQARRRA